MLYLAPQSKIFIAIQPLDFRRGIDSISTFCRLKLSLDPLSGAIFVFCNRSRNSIKFLYHDGQGFWLCNKRLSCGKFKSWLTSSKDEIIQVIYREFYIIINNANPKSANFSDDWRPLIT